MDQTWLRETGTNQEMLDKWRYDTACEEGTGENNRHEDREEAT